MLNKFGRKNKKFDTLQQNENTKDWKYNYSQQKLPPTNLEFNIKTNWDKV